MIEKNWVAFKKCLKCSNRDEKFEMFKRLINSMNKSNPNLKIRFLEEWKQIEKTKSDRNDN